MVQLRRFSLALAATLIVSPIVWDHYYVLLLLPVRRAVSWLSRSVIRAATACRCASLSHRYWPLTFAMKSPVVHVGRIGRRRLSVDRAAEGAEL